MIKEKKKQRFQFLEKLYNESNGSESYMVNMWELGQELEFDRETTSNIVDYLIDKGLLKPMTLGGGISITHYGIVEIEEAHEYPDKPTEHFMPINIINIQSMSNSSIQQGTNKSSQNNIFSSTNISELKTLTEKVESLIREIDDKNLKEELIAENDTLKAQVKSPKPKKNIIKESLKSIKEVMQKTSIKVASSQISRMIESLIDQAN